MVIYERDMVDDSKGTKKARFFSNKTKILLKRTGELDLKTFYGFLLETSRIRTTPMLGFTREVVSHYSATIY